VLFYSTLCIGQYAVGRLSLEPASVSRIVATFPFHASLLIAGAWMSLALAARWRRETTWVGWAGRMLGIVWIALHLVGNLRIFL
jgi:hypothetical protein